MRNWRYYLDNAAAGQLDDHNQVESTRRRWAVEAEAVAEAGSRIVGTRSADLAVETGSTVSALKVL